MLTKGPSLILEVEKDAEIDLINFCFVLKLRENVEGNFMLEPNLAYLSLSFLDHTVDYLTPVSLIFSLMEASCRPYPIIEGLPKYYSRQTELGESWLT